MTTETKASLPEPTPTSSSSTKTAKQQIEELLSPCRQCGKPQHYEVDEFCSPEEWLDRLRQKRERDPEWVERTLAIESCCDPCMAKMVQENRDTAKRERAARIRREAYGTCLVPEAAAHATFEKSEREYEERNVVYWLQAKEWYRRDENAWITGTPGSGKTFLARCVVNAFLDAGTTAAEISGIELAALVRDFHWIDKVKPYIEPRLLLIDDIDKALWSKEQLDILCHLLDKRIGRGRRLLVTSNVTPEHFREQIQRNRPENKAVAGMIFRRMLPEGNRKATTLRWDLV